MTVVSVAFATEAVKLWLPPLLTFAVLGKIVTDAGTGFCVRLTVAVPRAPEAEFLAVIMTVGSVGTKPGAL
jgi:hypothetical protein